MAAVLLDPLTTQRSGTAIVFETPDVTDGVEFVNKSKKQILLVKNASAAPINVTIDITKTLDGMTLTDRVIAVAAGAQVAIGPFPDIYMQSDGYVRAKFSAVADVSAAVIVPGSLSL